VRITWGDSGQPPIDGPVSDITLADSLIQGQVHTAVDCTPGPGLGWVGMIRKVYEIDPLLCPSCGGKMSIISFIEEPKTIDRIIRHLELTFEAERPPPPHHIQQELLMAAEESGEYF
jgi:hypothetical protein